MDPSWPWLSIANVVLLIGVLGGSVAFYTRLNHIVKSSELALRNEIEELRTIIEFHQKEMRSLRTKMKYEMQSLRNEIKCDIMEVQDGFNELGSRIHAVERSVEGLNQNSDPIRSLLTPISQEAARSALINEYRRTRGDILN